MARYTMDIGADLDSTLTNLANSKGVSKSEIIRNAIATYSYLQKETKQGESTVSITKDAQILKDIVLP